jgi:hypothetical protein
LVAVVVVRNQVVLAPVKMGEALTLILPRYLMLVVVLVVVVRLVQVSLEDKVVVQVLPAAVGAVPVVLVQVIIPVVVAVRVVTIYQEVTVARADLQVPPVLAALTVAVAAVAERMVRMAIRRGEAVVPAYTVKVRTVPVVRTVPMV